MSIDKQQINSIFRISSSELLSDPSEIDPIPFGNQCRLYIRIKHPLFHTQRIGLVAGIQYQGRLYLPLCIQLLKEKETI